MSKSEANKLHDMTFHVGEYIQEELEVRGWSTADCAIRMGGDLAINEYSLDILLAAVDAPQDHAIRELLLDKETADGLAKVFGASSQLWLNIDSSYHRTRKAIIDAAEGAK